MPNFFLIQLYLFQVKLPGLFENVVLGFNGISLFQELCFNDTICLSRALITSPFPINS